MIGMLSIGKSDYETIEIFREKAEFITDSIAYIRQMTPKPVLLRLYSDNAGQDDFASIKQDKVIYNLRLNKAFI